MSHKTAQVDIAYVNPAKPGKKMGSIKTREGMMYFVYSDKLHLFQPGVCTIEYKDDPGADGKPFYKALGVVGGGMPASDNLNAAPAPQTTARHNTAAPWPGPQVTRVNPPANDMSRSEHIFVCGALNSAIKSGQLKWNDPELVNAINKFRSAYSATFGADEAAA